MPKSTFIEPDRTVVVDAERGETLLEIAESNGVKMGSACGGVCACSSCHAWIRGGFDELPEMNDAEADRLDMAFDVKPCSRLGCQVKVGDDDLTVEVTPESITTWYNEHPNERK
ncbi:MAG: 2Fe-2S iron-sulfur cluster-binding protein [Nannocystaceae bacterium]